MPKILAKSDNLNELNANYAQVPLSEPVFLNSVPKSGTHLLRNIMRMFVPVEQQYHDTFIQHAILHQHRSALNPASPKLSWGHLLYSDMSAIALRPVNQILLVRDPYSWVLARARFFISDNFEANLEHLKGGNVAADELMNMMIFGIHDKIPTLLDIYTHNCLSWLGTKAEVIKYEDLIAAVKGLGSDESEDFFAELLGKCGIAEMPDDWEDRVRVGSDRKQSGTARENLAGDTDGIPSELPDIQKQLVDVAAPGLRKILGYV